MTAEERLLLDSALVAASALIGTSLSVVGEPLEGGDRSVVVRARRSDTHQTVIVKGYDAGRGGEGWAREAAALTALAGLSTGAPALVAATASPPVVVMEDLGRGDSVASALLAADPVTAGQAVVDWAEALADLHAATWNNVARFEAALSDLGGPTPPHPQALPDVLTDGIERLRQAVDPMGIEVSEQVTGEIVTIAARLGAEVQVLSPSDACPDNNIRTATRSAVDRLRGRGGGPPCLGCRLPPSPVAVVLVRLADARRRRGAGPAGLARAASGWACAQRDRP